MKPRREVILVFVKVRRVEQEAFVAYEKSRSLFTDSALAYHCDDVASRHRVDEHRPLLECSALNVRRHRACSFHHRNASGTPTSGRTGGFHPSSSRARREVNGLSLAMKSSDADAETGSEPDRRAARSRIAGGTTSRSNQTGTPTSRISRCSPSPASRRKAASVTS